MGMNDKEPATVSDRKRAANLANAQKSTGPRTLEGKAHSSWNAMTHGLLSRRLLLPDETFEQLTAFADAWRAQLAPATPVEEFWLHAIITTAWRLQRGANLEAAYLRWIQAPAEGQVLESDDEGVGSAVRHGKSPESLLNIVRYETSLQRQLVRQLDEFNRAQAARPSRRGAGQPAILDAILPRPLKIEHDTRGAAPANPA